MNIQEPFFLFPGRSNEKRSNEFRRDIGLQQLSAAVSSFNIGANCVLVAEPDVAEFFKNTVLRRHYCSDGDFYLCGPQRDF